MLLPQDSPYGENGILVFADCAVVPDPDASQLAQIAVCSAETARIVAGIEPRVAMLTFSTKGSAKHERVDKVIEAAKIAHEMAPDLKLDGELQADAAMVPTVGSLKAPQSEIAGKANVLVFPSLEVGNIAYKLVQRLAGVEAVGPLLQGLAAPVSDLSRGCSASDIYKTIVMTANQSIK
jgi:phosphate acetyltransferase